MLGGISGLSAYSQYEVWNIPLSRQASDTSVISDLAQLGVSESGSYIPSQQSSSQYSHHTLTFLLSGFLADDAAC